MNALRGMRVLIVLGMCAANADGEWDGVGRWQTPAGDRVAEFLADGNLVLVFHEPTVRYRRQPDGSRVEEPFTNLVTHVGIYDAQADGTLRMELATDGQSHARQQFCRLSFDESRHTMATENGGTNTVWIRADMPVAAAQRPLVALWRRTGNLTTDYVNMGLLFTPGGLSVHIGRNCPWDARSSKGVAGFFCRVVRYEVTEPGELLETELQGFTPRQRTLSFRLQGHRLQIAWGDGHGWQYDRVTGRFAFLQGMFDVQHWMQLPVVSP